MGVVYEREKWKPAGGLKTGEPGGGSVIVQLRIPGVVSRAESFTEPKQLWMPGRRIIILGKWEYRYWARGEEAAGGAVQTRHR